MPPSSHKNLSDLELVQLVHQGDERAFDELWRRHRPAGLAAARAITRRFEAEDLVAEAYTRILATVRRGKGPQDAFRPYLYASLRNIARSWAASPAEVTGTDWPEEADPDPYNDPEQVALSRSMTGSAFRSLPDKWRTVLWYTAVEGMEPQEVAPLLGISPNGVAALAYRAREGLRQAWIQAHVADPGADPECRWTIAHLGGYARSALSARDRTRIERHLGTCAKCLIASEEADRVAEQLGTVLLPVALGGAAGIALLTSLGASAVAALTGAAPGVEGSAATGGAAAATTGGAIWMSVAAGVALVAAAAAGIALVAGGDDGSETTTAGPAPTEEPFSEPAPTDPEAEPETAPRTEDHEDAAADEGQETAPPDDPGTIRPDPPTVPPVILSPTPGLLTNDPRPTLTGTGIPGSLIRVRVGGAVIASSTVTAGGHWEATPTGDIPDGARTLTVRQSNAGGQSPPATLTLVIDTVAPDAPIVMVEADADQLLLPFVEVEGEAGTTARVLRDGGTLVAEGTIGPSELLDLGQVDLPAGDHDLHVELVDPAGNASAPSPVTPVSLVSPVAVATPVDGSGMVAGTPFAVAVTGPPGMTVQILVRRCIADPAEPGECLDDTGWLTVLDSDNGGADYFTITAGGETSFTLDFNLPPENGPGRYTLLARYIEPGTPGHPVGVSVTSAFTLAE